MATALFSALVMTGMTWAATTTSVSQYGITWTFDHAYEVGQFCNGDWWVQGPVTIINLTPKSIDSSGRVINGSMLNPAIATAQGFDSRIYGTYAAADYSASLNVGRPGGADLSAANPLTITTGTLISGISYTDHPATETNQVHLMAALTVLAAAPAPGSFRPPLTGTDKTIRHNASELAYVQLPGITPVAGISPATTTGASYATLAATLAGVAPGFEKIRPDWIPTWLGKQNFLPQDNMPAYGTAVASQTSDAALLLCLSVGDEATKRLLALRLVQIGLDYYAMTQQSGGLTNWIANGGHTPGRVFPILFAAWMLQDSTMQNVMSTSGNYAYESGHNEFSLPADFLHFGEIDQTFYVTQRQVDMTHGVGGYGTWDPDDRDTATAYETADIGSPEWGINHCNYPTRDNRYWDASYRESNAITWSGFVLASRIMGINSLYNHEPLFDYMDRWMTRQGAEGAYHRPFQQTMWDRYRAEYGCVYTGVDTLTHERRYDCSRCVHNCPQSITGDRQPIPRNMHGFSIPAHPAGEWLLVSNASGSKPGTIELYDVRGAVVKNKSIHGKRLMIDLREVASGVYVCHLPDGASRKVVVTH